MNDFPGFNCWFVIERLVEELKRKNASLEAKLRTLSICSLCAQPLKAQLEDVPSASASVFTSKKSDSDDTDIPPDTKPAAENDLSLADLGERFGLLALRDKMFFGSSSTFALMSSAIAVRRVDYMHITGLTSHDR
jgi:hypothetical protein